MKKKIPYGISNYEDLQKEHYYYVDKTKHIEHFESLGEKVLFFTRSRRFGKSLFLSMLESYYDVNKKEDFDILFKDTYIGKNPTPLRNSYYVLRLDFSGLITTNEDKLYESFSNKVKDKILDFIDKYKKDLHNLKWYEEEIKKRTDPASIIRIIGNIVGDKKVYLLIDEYDNFANALLSQKDKETYLNILHGTGFVKSFYAELKDLTQSVIDRIFITGVSPLMMNDITSGFNIAKYKTTDIFFNEVLGFTHKDVRELVEYYLDFIPDVSTLNTSLTQASFSPLLPEERVRVRREEKGGLRGVLEKIEYLYDGYLFNEDAKEKMFNSDMVLYYISEYYEKKKEPKEVLDVNLMTDYTKLQSLFLVQERLKEAVVEEVITTGKTMVRLEELFQLHKLQDIDNFKSLLFYLGFLTIEKCIENKRYIMKIPNNVIKKLYWELIYNLLKDREVVKINTEDIEKIYVKLGDGEIKEFIDMIFRTMKNYISYRDLVNFSEKHLKMLFLMLLKMMSDNLEIISEKEVSEGFVDILIVPNEKIREFFKYSYLFELKYAKGGTKGDKIQELIEEGKEQIERYKRDEKLMKNIQGTDFKSSVIIFFGKKNYKIITN